MIIIRAKLNHQKRVYRDIVVDPQMSLYYLAAAVVDAFAFDFDHCFGFFSSPDIYGKGKDKTHYELFYDINEEVEELTESVQETLLNRLFERPQDKWWMLFDYGDDWVFELVYQKDAPPLFAKKKSGSVIASSGEAPEQYPDWEDD